MAEASSRAPSQETQSWQERLGHSQVSVTLDTYRHVAPSLQREAAGRIDELL